MYDLSEKPVILAVDDTPENLDVVKGLLVPEFQVRAAPNGRVALKIAESQLPDLILLDIMMPDMDGYEVCRQLKSNPKTSAIPVIFLTAKGETSDEKKGFALGASDYILKPVNPPILLARVRTHLTLKNTIDQLQTTTEELAQAKAKMEDELNVGKRIQHGLLPTAYPDDSRFSISAVMQAARQVGGDLFDYFYLSPTVFCVCVGDVSDKGVPAALFMAVTKTLLRTNTQDDSSTASVITRINDELAKDNESSMFVTMFIAICDLTTGRVCYTNAGHNPPYVKRANGEVQQLKQLHGPVAGAMEGLAYKQSEITLDKGDQLFLYTDGVSEAMNEQGELMGDEAIVDVLSQIDDNHPEKSIQGVLGAVEQFASGCEQSDDITMLSFRLDSDIQSVEQHDLELTLINELVEIDRINDQFNEFAESVDIPMPISFKMNMVFDELLNNIISYAYEDSGEHQIEVRINVSGRLLVISIEDDGIPFNPFLRPAPDTGATLDEREIGGLGIHLVKNVMDDVSYKRQLNKNKLTLIKQLDN